MNAGRQIPSRRLKILFCVPEVPYPADSGLKVRVFNLARELARRHEVHLFCLSRAAADPAALAVIKDAGIAVTVLEKPRVKPALKLTAYLSRLVRGVPLPFILSWEKAIFRGLDGLAADGFDVIVAEHLFMARYVLKVNAVKVITEHNVEWELAAQLASSRPAPQRWFRRAEAAWIASYEKKMLRSFNGTVAVSEPDRKAFAAMAPAVPVTLVGNGVDCGRYLELLEAPRPNEDAVFWFVREVLPRITVSYPDAVFTIAGAQPTERVLALDNGAGVRVAGAVADVRDCYRENSVMVVPLNFGGGSRLKILEAFAAGTPVVSTAKGAEGLDAENERHLLIADTPEAFAAAVIRLHEDGQLYRELERNARRLAEERYDWPVQAALLEQALLDALGRRSALPDRTNG